VTLPIFIESWKAAIESGKAPREIAQTCYHSDGVLKGTVWSKAVQGHDEITKYFEHFTTGKNNASVTFDTITKTPSGSYAGEYTFRWEDDEGAPQSAEANYTFEQATTDDGREVISLHHSSFFVPES